MIMIISLLCSFFSLSLFAEEAFRDYLIQSPKISKSERGSLKGEFAELGTNALNEKSGSFSVELPIAFPSIRGKMQLPFKVTYSPGFGFSEYGIGFDHALKVTRFRENGKINYSNDDLMTPWGQFVLAKDGYWYPKDLRSKIRASLKERVLQVYLPDGIVAIFGDNSSDSYNELNDRKILSWGLSKTFDHQGHRTTYSYGKFQADGKNYLDKIEYGGVGNNFQYRIEFLYEKIKNDFTDYSLSFKSVKNRKVSRIKINVLNSKTFNNIYSYHLTYFESLNSPSFYLKSLQKNYSTGASEPEIQFKYDLPYEQLPNVKWERETALDSLAFKYKGQITNLEKSSLVDFNNDGLIDLEIGKDYQRFVNKNGTFEDLGAPAPKGEVNHWCLYPTYNSRMPRKFIQLNQDNTALYNFIFYNSDLKTKMVICSFNGEELTTVNFPKYWGPKDRTSFADLNGDGLVDLIRLNSGFYEIIYNTSERKENGKISFSAPTDYIYLNLPPTYNYSAFWIMDMNGDNVPDLVLKGHSIFYVHYGHADGSFEKNYVTLGLYHSTGYLNANNLTDSEVTWVDVNKDSLPDLIMQNNGNIYVDINTGTSFVNVTPTGLFINPALYKNMAVTNITAKGQTQILSSIYTLNDSYILKLDLDAPSSGLLTSLKDGKGNELKFEYKKANPQAGVSKRKTVLSKITKITTGKTPATTSFKFSMISKNNNTNNFLGFSKIESTQDNRGKTIYHYTYDSENLDRLDSKVSFDINNPLLIQFEETEYENKFFDSLTFPIAIKTKAGIRKTDTGEESATIKEFTYNDNFCVSNQIQSSLSLIQEKKISFDDLESFKNHFSCLENEIELYGSGNNVNLNYNHKLKIERDSIGRIINIKNGNDHAIKLQSMAYGENGLIKSISKAGRGTSYFEYDTHFRLNKMTNPDLTENIIGEFDPSNDYPLSTILKRGEYSIENNYRYDSLSRLLKSWDNLGRYTEKNPQVIYDYAYANDNSPGKIVEQLNLEKTPGAFDKNQKIFLKTADDKDLATISETEDAFIVRGLTEFRPDKGETFKIIDYSLSNNRDFLNFKITDLDFSKEKLEESRSDFLEKQKNSNQLIQTNVIKNVHQEEFVSNGMVVKKETLNNNSNLETLKVVNSFGHLVQYVNQENNKYQYIHDSLGRISKIILPDNSKQIITYDKDLGEISTIERENIGRIEYTYNFSTALLQEKRRYDRLGVYQLKENYSYDLIGRMLTKKLTQINPNGSEGSSTLYSYSYDGLNLGTELRKGQEGFLTGITSKAFSKSFIYRADGKIIQSIVTIFGFKQFTTQYSYLSHGEINTKTQTITDLNTKSTEVSYSTLNEYDRFGNISQIKHNNRPFAHFSYNHFGQLEKIDLAKNKKIKNYYDGLTRQALKHEELSNENTSLIQSWNFNDRGLIKNNLIESNQREISKDYDYSPKGYLSKMKQIDSKEGSLTTSYQYDLLGIMNNDSKNEMNTAHFIGLKKWAIGNTVYEIDSLGRVVKKDGRVFTYDESGRISHVSGTGARNANYYYDEENNPILKIYETGMTEVYIENNAYIGDTFYEPLKIEHRIVGYFKNGIFVSTSQDLLNTNIVDENGTVNIAGPYGERTMPRSEVNNVLDFTLKGYDRELEAVRMGHRYYDPHAKRFLSPDPFFLENPDRCVDSPVECNLYSYAGNNPISNVDPSGLSVFQIGVSGSEGTGLTSSQAYNAFNGSAYIGTRRTEEGSISGNALTVSEGHIAGPGGIGLGLNLSFDKRDVEDIKGSSQSQGFSIGPISISVTKDNKGDVVGGEIGVFKSIGLGYFETKNQSSVIEGSSPEQISRDVQKSYYGDKQ